MASSQEQAFAPTSMDMKKLFVLSSDTLRGVKTDQKIPDGWNERPPLFDPSKDEAQCLKEMTRKGIPPALRCAVWLSSVVRSSHPHQPDEYSAEYRTLAKVRLLDSTYDMVRKQVFSDASDETADPPLFGLSIDDFETLIRDVPEKGQRALTRVLCCAEHLLGIDHCVLLPTICTILLNCMSESYAFCAIREAAHNSSRFFPTSRREQHGWCMAFCDILKRLHPQTAKTMEDKGCLSVKGLDPIFKFMFIPILRQEHVLRIMDIYTYEGSKVLFRFGVALLCLCKKDLKEGNDPQKDWWQRVKDYTHSSDFQFDYLVKKAYGYHGSRHRKRIRFPRRHIIHRIIRIEEERAQLFDDATAIKPRPLGLVAQNETPVLLAKPAALRTSLAEWVPMSLRLTRLDLLFSTNHHGRTLERFYSRVHLAKNTITLIEVLNNGAVIGMYASQAWHSSPQIYGDGECFLFRASPNARAWKWRPDASPHDLDAEHQALQEQFMVGRDNYLSMGGNDDGSCGIRVNEDLTRGESAPAQGYGNEPLAGDNLRIFDIGLVEVYGLARP